MNKKRRNLVLLAFDVLDKDGSGELDLADMMAVYDVSSHPEFKSKKKTKEQILREMIDVFDVGGEKDGKVTKQEFLNYYQQISAGIENDTYFELMIRNAWHISGGEGQAANSANRRVLVTRADGSQAVEEVKYDLGLGAKDKSGTMARLQKQGVNAANVDFSGGMEDKNQRYRPNSAAPSFGRGGAQARNTQSLTPAALLARASRGDESLPPGDDDDRSDGDGVHPLMRKFKERVMARGCSGIVGLQRKFKIMDDDGSKSLNMAEFKKAMKETVPEFTDSDVTTLFRIFGAYSAV
jgi:Ca2+-binding EF-hand superfamily protein